MSEDRFLLIKNWSFILWADIEHVLSQLLIAELTSRIPVVYWPTHCLHNGFVYTNGFELYFEPVSPYNIFDISKPEYSYFPPLWDSDNLLSEDNEKKFYPNIGDILSSNCNVIVGDVFIDIYSLIPFIKKSHPVYGMTVYQIKCYLFRKYIRVKQDIDTEIEGFYNSWLRNEEPVLAVHVLKEKEGSEYGLKDKKILFIDPENGKKALKKNQRLLEANKIYHGEIKKFIEKFNVKKIFLLTNCEDAVKEYQQKYGSMVIFANCQRSKHDESKTSIENSMVKRRRGIEIVKDAYLASKCDFFIGSDFSSLSHCVTYMKDWPQKNVRILYHQIKNRKYPVNVSLILKPEGCKLIKRIVGWVKKLFRID